MKRSMKLAALGGALALAAAVFVAPRAFAHGGWGFGADRGQDLADALGIPIDELQAAQDKAMDANLDRMVESGRIDAEQADLMRARRALDRSIDREALMAEALGVTPEALADARADGSTQDLLEEQSLDKAAYAERFQAAYDKAVAKAVTDGVITQAQADALKDAGGKFGMGGGCTGGGMQGHGMRGFGGVPDGARMRGFHRGMPGGAQTDGEQTRGWAPRAPQRTLWSGSDA